MNTAGLALDQAPPFGAPLRFFLTAPLFLAGAALLILVRDDPASALAPVALAAVHLTALGFVAMVMAGALLQMLPVAAGSPLPAASRLAAFVHFGLTLGTPALAAAFLGGAPWLFGLAAALLGSAFAALLLAALAAMLRSRDGGPTRFGLLLATAAGLAGIGMGLTLALGRGNFIQIPYAALALQHPRWALGGWAGLTILAVAMQVIPMFHMTPAVRPAIHRLLPTLLFAALALGVAAADLGRIAIGLVVLAGAILLPVLVQRRRRKVPDFTVFTWRLAALVLAASGLAFAGGQTAIAGILFLCGAIAVIYGMLAKIVPFLAWFHLQGSFMGNRSIPPMAGFLPAKAMAAIRYTLPVAMLALPWPKISAALWLGLALGLEWVLLRAWLRYRSVERECRAGAATPIATT